MAALTEKSRGIRLTRINENLFLTIYFILALEYDLYSFFNFGALIAGNVLTMLEIVVLLYIMFTTFKGVYSHHLVYLLLLLSIGWTYSAFPELRETLISLFFEGSSVKKVFLLPLAARCIRNPRTFWKKFYRFCIVEGYVHIICNAILGYGYTEWGVFNYMVFGMAMLTPTVVVMQKSFSMPTRFDIITFVFFELNIIIYGHRGALLITAIMMLIFFLRYINAKRKVLIIISGLMVLTLLILARDFIIQRMINLMSSIGLESRTLEKLLSGNIADDSERNLLWGIMISNILRYFPMGQGIGSDRLLLKQTVRAGLYAHNFILELCGDFGLILGLLVSIWIFYIVYKSVFKLNNEDWYRLIVPVLVPSVLTLLFSASIYQYWLFWLSLGLYYCYFGKRIFSRQRQVKRNRYV